MEQQKSCESESTGRTFTLRFGMALACGLEETLLVKMFSHSVIPFELRLVLGGFDLASGVKELL